MDVAPSHIDIYFNDRSFRIMEKLKEKASELDVPVVQLAMAWPMTDPTVTAVLVGARETRHIDNEIAAYQMALDPDLRAEMSAWN